MKMDLHNEVGEIVELETRPPNPTGNGVYSLTFVFPNISKSRVRTVTLDRYEMRALILALLQESI